MIRWVRGNIFDSEAELLVDPVNCVGISGAGLAKEFKQRYPNAVKAYEAACREGLIAIGQGLWVDCVYFFPTKDHWRRPSQLEYIEAGLRDFVTRIAIFHSVAFPALGCGLGGLRWPAVKALMEKYLADLDLDIEIYQP